MRRLASVAGLALAGWILAGCGEDEPTTTIPTGRSVDASVQVGDTTRTYRLFIPYISDTASADLPLVVAFHDSNNSGVGFQNLTGFNAYADQFGFFVAYPNSMTGDWAEGCDCSQADLAGVNDTGFVRLLIEDVDADYNIDRTRVYATGYSAGALFTYRLACELSDEFAAFAAVSGPMSVPLSETCDPALPMPFLGIQGMDDETFPWEGGGQGINAVMGADSTAAYWARENGCPGPRQQTARLDEVDDGTVVYVWRYEDCSGGSEASLIGVDGGVHAWWISSEFVTTQVIVGFLLLFQR